MNNVYLSGQASYDLALPEDEVESDVPDDFFDFIMLEEMQLDVLPLNVLASVRESLMKNKEFVDYVSDRYTEQLDIDDLY